MEILITKGVEMSNRKLNVHAGDKFKVKGISVDPTNGRKAYMIYLRNGFATSVYANEFEEIVKN